MHVSIKAVVICFLLLSILMFVTKQWSPDYEEVSTYTSCLQKGYQKKGATDCVTPDGRRFVREENGLPSGGVACTMEAFVCPDGSYVGRTGPNCEFATCPGK
ncbi:hypothetical protein KBA63_01435 [Candidatus Woesebacteria bacterium]|jgi:hypothetical protein|nr:hypothetical protein [Candidatus Woesebacteria bacterium]MBP9687386.1 hypothetical protein [Candidatus Woesebacteria bacterium]